MDWKATKYSDRTLEEKCCVKFWQFLNGREIRLRSSKK